MFSIDSLKSFRISEYDVKQIFVLAPTHNITFYFTIYIFTSLHGKVQTIVLVHLDDFII